MNAGDAASGRPAHILIVDDEPSNRQLLEVMLAPDGFHVELASSGAAALAAVARQPPDLILLDVMMPDLDGHEVAARLKGDAATTHIPIIMVTALDNRDAKILGLSAGVEDYLTKPVDRTELRARVRNLLRLKAHGDFHERRSGVLAQEAALQAALEQSRQDQLRFKNDFLSHVSHELRSPLTAIKQFTSILLGGLAGELNPEQAGYQQIVLNNVAQLQAMIDDLLEVTRIENGKLSVRMERVAVADAVSRAVDTMRETARARRIAISHDVPGDLTAHADPTRLQQILVILLDNAIKFTAETGAVAIQVRPWPQDAAFLLVEVSDTGSGIAPELAERLFERLYQAESAPASRKGLGLGLYICKALVTRHGGTITARRGPVQGSIFAFTLPVFPCDTYEPDEAAGTAALESEAASHA